MLQVSRLLPGDELQQLGSYLEGARAEVRGSKAYRVLKMITPPPAPHSYSSANTALHTGSGGPRPLTLRKLRYPTILSSSRLEPNMESTFNKGRAGVEGESPETRETARRAATSLIG